MGKRTSKIEKSIVGLLIVSILTVGTPLTSFAGSDVWNFDVNQKSLPAAAYAFTVEHKFAKDTVLFSDVGLQRIKQDTSNPKLKIISSSGIGFQLDERTRVTGGVGIASFDEESTDVYISTGLTRSF